MARPVPLLGYAGAEDRKARARSSLLDRAVSAHPLFSLARRSDTVASYMSSVHSRGCEDYSRWVTIIAIIWLEQKVGHEQDGLKG
jgi:hypothetical protein